uniref:Viral_Rep domain-containing protein n=1 Tax=Onchocerca volvulus TaxID=6282 RepID=A0A8R1TN48_ONCVO
MTTSGNNTSSRAKRWVLTVFDVDNFNSNLIQTIGNGIAYAIIGKETCPTTGRQHLQCFLKFNSPVRFSTLQAKIPRGTHIESAKGTNFQNFKYCSKEAIQEEIGTRPIEPKKRKSEIQ